MHGIPGYAVVQIRSVVIDRFDESASVLVRGLCGSSQRQICHGRWSVPAGVLTTDRRPTVDTVTGRQSSEALTTATQHRTAERTPRRVVQEKVGGKVGVEQILESTRYAVMTIFTD